MAAEVQLNTREATLNLLLKQGELSASKLASLMGISVQAMRRHLRNLENDGLIESASISLGPGRPSNLWYLTSLGHNCFNNGNGSEKFALDLLGSIQENLTPKAFIDVLGEQAIQKAKVYRKKIGVGPIEVRLEKLVELRNEEGNVSEIQSLDDGAKSWYLHAFHCSIRAIAEKFPLVCDQELQLIRYIFPDCTVERIQWSIETGQPCGFKITPY